MAEIRVEAALKIFLTIILLRSVKFAHTWLGSVSDIVELLLADEVGLVLEKS